MTRTVLGELAKAEIIECMGRCRTRAERSSEADRLSAHFKVGKDRIYAVTKAVRPARKMRSDKGKRIVDIRQDEALRLVAGWVLEYDVSPAEAINMARDRGLEVPIEFPTLTRYLREAGLDKKARRNATTPHRRFEASAPGEMFQFDISGLKSRWLDQKTRRIISVSSLEVSKNHENTNNDRVRVWRFALIDDFSRRCFIRYVGVAKPNSSHVVDFLLQAYSELGVPQTLYTDNDAIIKFGRNARTTEILNKVLLDQGGYQNTFHLPGNSRATGKVERLHQTVEQCEKFIGPYIAERGQLTLEALNDQFARGVMHKLNNSVHSETGQKPIERWENTLSVIRRLDYASLRSAFMADEHEVKLKGDLTFRLKGKTYQLPQSEIYPFANWTTRSEKLRIIFPDDQPFFTVVGFDGLEYDVPKDLYKPDTAGEYRSTAQTDAETLRKELKQVAKEDAKRVRTVAGEGRVAEPIRFFDESVNDQPAAMPSNIARFPKPETVAVPLERLAEAAPGRVREELYTGRMLTFWEACDLYKQRFSTLSECKSFMDSMFASRDETCFVPQSEIESGIDAGRQIEAAPQRILRAV